MKPLVPHNRLTFGSRESAAVRRVIDSGYWASGKRAVQLEGKLARAAGVAHGVTVGSGLAALRLALLGLGVRRGDEVIVPAYCCVALANAVLAVGARPVICDIERPTWNLDPVAARKCLTKKTRAVIAVHAFGAPAPIDELTFPRVPVIEDCAHAFGVRLGNATLGSQGHAAVLSFYATKLIGAGEGGAVLTDDQTLADFVRDWRDYADKTPDKTRLNDKMTDVEAALALCQLRRLGSMIAVRRRNAERYGDLLATPQAESGAFQVPQMRDERVWYRYVIEIHGGRLPEIIAALRKQGVHADMPVEPWFDVDAAAGTCPNATYAFRHLLSLPLYPTLTMTEQRRVVAVFTEAIRGLKRHAKHSR
jgi:dTDP-4-amino-4,6-dideoxygalactose transaminase